MSWRRGNVPNQRRWRAVPVGDFGPGQLDLPTLRETRRRFRSGPHTRRMTAGAFDPTNCQTLCRRCHILKTIDERAGKPNPERDAWIAYMERSLTDNV